MHSHGIGICALVVLLAAVTGPARATSRDAAVELDATWPGEQGPTVKVEAFPILERVVDEATEKATVRLGKRQTYAYLKPDVKVLRMPLEPGAWRLHLEPDGTTDGRDVDVNLAAGATERITLRFGKLVVAPRTVADGAMPAKVEVYRGKERVFYGYSKDDRKNVVVNLFPGPLRIRINGDDETENFAERELTLAEGATERVEAAFGLVEVKAIVIAKAKVEFFALAGDRAGPRIVYRYAKRDQPDASRLTLHLRPGRYVVVVTDEDTDRKTESRLEVPADRAIRLDV